ncbi:hypothetical protein BRC82_02920 [Halobacteriales archaeon QS_1_67_19]|nr:MAG: hypothetical protein BRC82_02920 [Halobacteriales archaeon QS_1_67_19]
MPEIDRRTLVRTALAGAGLAFAGTAGAQETETETGTETADDGLVTVESDEDFEATVERISSAVEDSENLTLVATVDHAENAESADLELPPTTVLMFGNPRLGTQLMRDTQSAGIDLPRRCSSGRPRTARSTSPTTILNGWPSATASRRPKWPSSASRRRSNRWRPASSRPAFLAVSSVRCD